MMEDAPDIEEHDWLFVSPHADDVAWSCGGVIAARGSVGGACVVTVFDGDSDHATSPVVERRKRDDRSAAALLSAKLVSIGLAEAMLRTHAGKPLYPSVLAARRSVDPRDEAPGLVAETLSPLLSKAKVLFLPLAQRSHVDHAIVRFEAERLARQDAGLYYYEEFPYSAGVSPAGLVRTMLPCIKPAWLAAADCYAGEAKRLFGDEALFRTRLEEFIDARVRISGGLAEFPVYRMAAR